MSRKIKSREELLQLLAVGIETITIEETLNESKMYTIIYDEDYDCFLRIYWGIVIKNDVEFTWFEPKCERVVLNPKGHIGWFNKKEEKELIREVSNYEQLSQMLSKVEHNMVDLSDSVNFGLENVSLIGGATGKGKTYYSTMKTLEAMIAGKAVLFLATDCDREEMFSRMIDVIKCTPIKNRLWDNFDEKTQEKQDALIEEFFKKSTLRVVYNPLMDTNFIIDEMKNYGVNSDYKRKVDFVVLDALKLSIGENDNDGMSNSEVIKDIIYIINRAANEINTEVLITSQLNSAHLK